MCAGLRDDFKAVEVKLDNLIVEVNQLRTDLEVHKAKTSKLSMLMGGLASLAVAVAAVLLKGCM